MELVDDRVVSSSKDDDELFDSDRPVAVTQLGRGACRVLDALPLQVEELLGWASRLVRGRLHFLRTFYACAYGLGVESGYARTYAREYRDIIISSIGYN